MLYFDASFLFPLFVPEPSSPIIERFFTGRQTEPLAVSQWTCLEFSSTLAHCVRTKRLDAASAALADTEFDAVINETFLVLPPSGKDFELGREYLQKYKAGLRAGDALHLAIAANNKAGAIYSLDQTLLKAGRQLGLPVRTGVRLP